MNTDYEGPTIISSLFNADFLGRPYMRQTVMIPWFYLEAHVRYGKEFVGEMLMVSSFEALKDILKVQHESFRVRSIQYVTPGFVNETGHWKMEPLLEASEAINPQGERVPLFKVSDRTYTHLGVNTEVNLKSVRVLFPVVQKKRD
ncbi:hypothetical protein IMF27_05415 [Pseudomonas sp. PCH199]|uniref:hypothetical protein n=1 Tax=unclassified Pseudomonas TaxID=196821 RepID=UPI000BD68169|nr:MULTISPECIES: hypothetical protein [unclassified Pseudomonas]MCW8275210.1 hypothetical protein [Pseudomonas sp. PCH199]PAM84878.1 hypothetical protein CES87_05535 [Pseudomonas sp. ERMR1:02]